MVSNSDEENWSIKQRQYDSFLWKEKKAFF